MPIHIWRIGAAPLPGVLMRSILAGLCVLAVGCTSGSHAVCVGRLEGQNGPIKTGEIRLVSLDDPDELPAKGELESDGHFEVFTDHSSGLVPVGRYRIEYAGATGADATFAGWPVTPAEVLVHKGQNYLDLELVAPPNLQVSR
jgi:hypothetical protein